MSINKISRLVSSIEFEKIYMIRSKRISKGYSDRELSFLLGYRLLYVRDIENPTEKLRYSPTDTNLLQCIFECLLSELMPPKIAERYYTIQVITEILEPNQSTADNPNPHFPLAKKTAKKTSEIISHDIYMVNFDSQLIPWLFFTPGKEAYPIDFDSFQKVRDIVDEVEKLFNNGYFNEPKTAWEIFEHCVKTFDKSVRPCDVADAIGYYTGKRKAPRLVKGRNDMGRETYQKQQMS